MSNPGRHEMELQTTDNPSGDLVACFECTTTFDPLEAFQNNGCPGCPATIDRLFDQRDAAEKATTQDLIGEAEPEEATL